MVLKAAILPAILFVLFAGNSNAQTHPYSNSPYTLTSDQQEGFLDQALETASKIKLRVGLDTHHETYTEYAAGDKLMQEKGPMYGILLSADVPVGTKGTVALDWQYVTGKSEYIGSHVGGRFGDVKTKWQDRSMYKLSGTYKHRFDSIGGVVLGAGLDYRSLTDRLDQAGAAGYERKNTSWWAHATIEGKLGLSNTWSVTPQAKVSYLLTGTQTAELLGGFKFEQDKGYGYEVALDFSGKVPILGHPQHISIKPYYRYLEVKDSKESRGWFEPRNKTKEIGLQLAVIF